MRDPPPPDRIDGPQSPPEPCSSRLRRLRAPGRRESPPAFRNLAPRRRDKRPDGAEDESAVPQPGGDSPARDHKRRSGQENVACPKKEGHEAGFLPSS